MNTTVKVISVDGDVWRFSNTNKKLILKKGAKLQTKDVLHLSEESNVVLQLSNGRVVEIQGKDLTNNDGNFSLSSLLGESNSDIDKIVNFAKSFQQMNESEQQNDVVRLDDGRVFKKEGKDYVEIAGESFEGDPEATQGGHRFVQVVRMGENLVADGISPLMLNRISNAPSSMGLEFPSSTSSYRPQEHTMGGGSWKGLGVVTPPVAAVNSVVKYEGQYLVHTVTVSKKNSSPYDVIVTVTESGKGIGHATLGVDTGIIEYSIDGGTTWQVANPSTDGSFAVELPSNHTSFLVRVPSTVDSIYEGKETYNITAHTEYQREILPEGHGTGTILDGGEHPENPSKPGEPKVPTTPPTDPNDPEDPNYHDDDRPVAVVTSDAVYEGQHLIHKVTLSNDSVTNTSVNVKLVDGTAELSTDTTSKVYIRYPNDNTWTEITSFNPDGSFNVTVEPGKHLEGFEVKVESTKDTQYEGKEQYTIQVKTEYQAHPLTNGTVVNGTSVNGTGTGTIVDDGSLPKNPSNPGTPQDPEKPIDPNNPKTPYTPPANPNHPNDPNYHDDDRPYATVDSDKVYEGDPLVHNVKLSNDSKYDTIVTVKLEKDTANVSGANTDIGTVYVRFKDENGNWKPWEQKTVRADGTFDVTVKPGKEHIDGFQVRVDSKSDNVYEGPEVYDISVKTQYQQVPVTNGGTGTGTIVDDGSPLINDLDSNPSKEDPKYPNDPNRPIDPNEPKVPNIPTKFHDDDRPVAFVNNDAQYEGDYLYHAIKVSNDSTTTTTVNVVLKDGTGPNGAELLKDLENNTTNPTVWVRLPGGSWTPVTFKSDGSFDVDLNGTTQHTQGFEIRVESKKDPQYEGKEHYTVEVKTQHQATPLNNGETVKVHGVDTVVNGTGTGTIVDDGSLPKNPSKVDPNDPNDPNHPIDPNQPKVPVIPPGNPSLPPGTPNYHDDDRPVAFVSNDAVYEGEKLVHLVQVSNDSKYQTSVNVKLTDDKGATADLASDLTGNVWVRFTDANGNFIPGSETLITSFNPDGSFNVPLTGTHDHVYGFQVIVESKGDTRYEGPEFYNIEVKTQHQDAPLTNGVTIDVHGTPTTVNGIGKGTIVDDGSRLPNDPKDVSPTTDNPTIPADPLDPNRPIDPNNPRLPNDPNQPHDDDRPVAYVTDDAVYEGDKLYHTIKVSNDSTTTTTVNVLLKDGTAEILTDLAKTGTNPIVEYTLDGTTWIAVTSFNPDGSFDVPLNGTAQHTNGFQIRVTSKVDSVLENTEQYTVEVKTQHQDTPLTNGTPVSIHGAPATPINGTGTGTIVDDGSALPPVNGQTTNPKDNPTVPADPLDPNRPIDPNDPRLPNDPNKAHDDDRPVAFVSSDAVHEGAYLYHDVKVTNDVKDPAATPTTVTVTLKDGNLATDGADLSSDLSNDPSYPAIEYSFDGVTWTTVTPNVTGTDLSFNVTLDSSSKHLNGFQVRVKSSVDSVYEGKEQYTIEVQTQYQDAPLAPNTSIEVHGVPSVVNGTGTGTIVDDGSLSPNPSTVDPADPNDPNRPIDPNNPKQPFDPNDPAAHDPEDPKYHDDDRPVAFVTSDAVYEGETLSHWVQLSNDIKQGTTQVTVTLSNGTATLFTDPTKPVADVDVPNVSIGWVDAAGNVIGALVPVTVLPNGTFIVNVPQGQHLDGFKVFIDSTVDQIHEGSEVYNISVVTEYQDNPLAANTTLDIGGTPTVVNGSGTGTIVDDGSLAPNPSTVDPADPANPIRPIDPTTPKDPTDPLQPHDDDRPIATITGGEMAEAVYDPLTGAAVIDPLTGQPEVRYIVHTVEVSNHSTSPTTVYIGLSNQTATLGTDTTTIEYRVLAADGGTWGAWTTAVVPTTGGEFALPTIPAYDDANPPATLPRFEVRVKVEADALDTELAEDYIITARTQHQLNATDNGNTAQDHTGANNDGTAHGRIHNAQTNIINGAVSEEDLVGGSANATATNNAVTSGSSAATGILVRATDDIHHVIIGDNSDPLATTKYADLTLAQLQALSPMNIVTIDTGEGTLVLNGYTTINGSEEGRISYTYTLKDPLTHTQSTNDTTLTDEIPVRVYGGNGDPSHPTTPGSYDPYGKLVITITDDVPQVGTGPGTTTVTVDETNFVAGQVSTTVNGFGATVISTIYGADGPATSDALVYSLSLGTVIDSGLKDTATGRDIWLYMDGYDIVGRVAAVGNIPSPTGDEAFRISITDAGDVTLTQKRPMDHQTDGSSAAAHDDALSMLANRVVLNVTVTDKDGDTATDSKNIGDKFIFKDDGPTIGTGSALSAAIVDESALVGGARTPTDPDGAGPLPPYGTSATIDVSGAFNPNYGTDGAGNVVKTLVVNGLVPTGLVDTLTGDAVVLTQVSGTVVEGRNSAGDVVFRITLSGNDVTLQQLRSMDHPLDGATNPDDSISLANGALSLQGVITDGDGDTATHSILIGDRFQFLDDAPTATDPLTAPIIDEKYLPLGSEPWNGTGSSPLVASDSLTVNFGADRGTGTTADVVFTATTINALNEWDTIALGETENNLTFIISNAGHTITASNAGGTVFTIDLTVNPATNAVSYTFTLSKALEHNGLSQLNIPLHGLSVVDADGDTVPLNFNVIVVDDEPPITPQAITVYEDLYVPQGNSTLAKAHKFNTNADATGANTYLSDPLTHNTLVKQIGVTVYVNGVAQTVDAYKTAHGYAVVETNGQISYYPDPDFSGTDTFEYTTNTDHGAKHYTVNMTVLPVSNDAPDLTSPTTVLTDEDTSVTLGLKKPAIDDSSDAAIADGDNSERLGAITLTLTGAGAAANAANTNTGATLTKGNDSALTETSVGSHTYTIVIVDALGQVDHTYHHAGITLGIPNTNYLTVAEYEAIKAAPGEHRHENFNVGVSVTSYEVDPTTNTILNNAGANESWGTGNDEVANAGDAIGIGATSTETIAVSVRAVTDDAYLDFTSGTLIDLGSGVYQGTTTQRTGNIENSAAPNKANYQVSFVDLDPTHDPDAVANPTATVTMYEDRILNLADILRAGFADVDGSEVRSITITNPTSSIIYVTYNNGTPVAIAAGGSNPFNITSQTAADFQKFTIYAPDHFSGELNGIGITINAQDKDGDGWSGANVGANGITEADTHDATPAVNNNTVILNLHIKPGAGDLAALTATTTAEDTPVAFLAKVAVTDTTGGNEVINSVGFTVPTDWKLLDPTGYTLHGGYAATNTGSGWWIDGTGNIAAGTGAFTIHFNNGTGTVLTEAQREAVLDLFHLQPPAHSSEDLAGANRIALTVETTDTNVTGSDTVTSTLYQAITVTAVAEGLELTGNVTITGSTTDYYLNAADNPVNWTAMNTDAAAANTNGDTSAHPNAQPGTADLTMNGNFRYTTHAFEDTWFDLATNGFDFKSPWYNEDGVGSGAGHGNQEQTSAVLNAYVVVRDAGGVITGLTLLTNASFQYKNAGGTVVASGTNGIAVPVANLDKVEFQSPNGFSGEVWIKVQAQTIDYNYENGAATTAKITGVAWLQDVLVEPKPDDVTLQVKQRIVMDEDSSQKLYIRTQTSDQDGSETFNVEIRGIPTGAKMEFAGHVYDTANPASWVFGNHELIDNGGGKFTLRLKDLPQGVIEPIYTPPLHSNTNGTDTEFTVYAESVDHLYINGQPPINTLPNPISSNQTIKISVIGVPDAPTLIITDGQTWIENNLDEHDGGVNTASAGGANLVDLSNFINPVTGIVHGESTYPTDSSETITLRITNMPADFDLVDAAGGPIITLGGGNGASRVWVLTTADLATAKIKLPVNYSGTVKFDVAPVVTENDGRATIFAKQNIEFYVTPSPEATLHLTSDVWEDVDNGTYGHNGELGRIDLIANTTVNGDTINETIYAVRFSKADLDAKGVTLYSDAAGTTPLVEVGGYYTVTGVTNVQSIYVRGPANFSGNIPISVDYIVADSTNDGTLGVNQTIYTGGGTSADWVSPTGHQTINHTLNFRPVTDDVDLTIPSITSTGTVVGNHATLTTSGSVTVNLGITKLPDANAGNAIDHDSSEHMNYLLITGVPDGVAVVGGVLTGDGQWIYPNTSSFGGALTDSIQFSVSNYADSLTSHPITITAVTQDGAARIKEDSETWLLTTTYGPGGPATILPKIELTPLHPDEVEDTNFALSHAVSAVIDFTGVNNGSAPYDMTITVRMPADDTTVFSGMNYIIVTEGSVPVKLWTKTVSVTNATAQSVLDAELANIMTDPDNHANSNAHNQGGQHMYPLDITVAFYSGGATSEDRVTSNVDLAPVTDPATLAIDATATDEGGIVPITINVTSTGGADENGDWTIVDGKLYLQVANGVDAVIAGQLQDSLGNPLATETDPAGLPAGTYYVLNGVAPNTPIQLQYAIDHDGTAEYQHGSFQLNGWVINQENGSTPLLSNGSDNIVINQVNTPPAVTVGATDSEHNGTGENAIGSVELNITLTIANGTDPHEKLYSAFIKDLPSGFTVYVGATEATATLANNAGEGVWSIPTPGGVLPTYISIKPPAYWSGTLDDLKLVLMSGEVSPATATEVNFDLVVTPVADGIADFKPTYSFNQTGNPLTTLNLNIGMRDSERVNNVAYDEYAELTRLQLTGIPDGLNTVFLANGAMIDPGRISLSGSTLTIIGLTQNELDNLQILHSPTAGKISITAAAQTYEVDASGAEVHTSGWTSAASAFDLQVTGTAPWNGTSGNDTRTGTAGNDILNGLAGNDTLNGGNGHDILNGGDGDDTLNGGAGNDYLIGGNGNDILNGDAGNDMLMGGAGNDTLNGGADNDILQGGAGSDSLTGGTGADTFVWGSNDIGLFATPDTDTITDFNWGQIDKIDATALLTALGWNGNDATLSQFVSASGTTIKIHDVAHTKGVDIVVTGQNFADLADMISKTNFQH